MTPLLKHLILLTLLSLLAFTHPALGQTHANNDEQLIRVEEGVKNLNIRFDDMNRRFDDMNKRIDAIETRMDKRFDELRGFMLWGFGITFSGMFFLVGFILWDRRTTLAPVAKETKELKELIELLQKDDEAVKKILKEYAKENDALSKILNKAAML